MKRFGFDGGGTKYMIHSDKDVEDFDKDDKDDKQKEDSLASKYIISGLKQNEAGGGYTAGRCNCSVHEHSHDHDHNHNHKQEVEHKHDNGEEANGKINEDGEEEENEDDTTTDTDDDTTTDKIIPMLCFSLVLIFLCTCLGVVLPFLTTALGYSLGPELSNSTSNFFLAMLVGEMGGVLMSIVFIALYCSCDASFGRFFRDYIYEMYMSFFFSINVKQLHEKNEYEAETSGGNYEKLKTV